MPPLPSARPMATLPTIRVARAATAASLLSSLTAAQTPAVTVLARAGDVLPSGDTIVDMSGAQIGNDGTWAALLLYGGGTPLDRARAGDGCVVLEVGDSLSSGSIVYSLNDLSVRVLGDGAPLVAGGDSIPTPLGPLEVQGIRTIDFDDGRLTMICTLLSTATIGEATWYGRVTPGGRIDDVGWVEGDLIPGSPNPCERGVIDTDLSGTYTSLAVELDGHRAADGVVLLIELGDLRLDVHVLLADLLEHAGGDDFLCHAHEADIALVAGVGAEREFGERQFAGIG